MCGGRSSILHYGPLIVTNNLYAPTPNGQSPSASLNKSNNPQPPPTWNVAQSPSCAQGPLGIVTFNTNKLINMDTPGLQFKLYS